LAAVFLMTVSPLKADEDRAFTGKLSFGLRELII